jgi:hypothetical protein
VRLRGPRHVEVGLPRVLHGELGAQEVPSHQLVMVRLGRAHTPDFDQTGINRLVSAIINPLAP